MNSQNIEIAKKIIAEGESRELVEELKDLIAEDMQEDWDGWYTIKNEGVLWDEIKKEKDRRYAMYLKAAEVA